MKTFEEILQDKHAAQYRGTDDLMPENFDEWLTDDLGPDDYIRYADEAIIDAEHQGFLRGMKKAKELLTGKENG